MRFSLPRLFAPALAAAILFGGLAQQSHAALIEADFLTAGDNLLTQDSATGLEWLDVTYTTSLSPNQILGGALGLLTTYGFRYATSGEVSALWTSEGIAVNGGFSFANEPGAINLQNLMGCTGFCSQTFDILQQGFSLPISISGGSINTPFITRDLSFGGNAVNPNIFVTSFDFSAQTVGHYLLRPSQVPEPGTLALFGLGLAGLGFARRHKAANQQLER